MRSRLRDQAGVAVLGPESFSGDAFADPFDAETDALAHLPFRTEFQAAVALASPIWCRPPAAPRPRSSRWTPTRLSGTASRRRTGREHVGLLGGRARLARRLLQWRAAGVLLALVSNNDEATVRAVLDRPDSPLRLSTSV
ncbi:hypothetical protein LV779_14985 [Streptomyces thinghirensis]|nr:hypothetical protein [Streptomyces thinghirensis]